MDKHSQKRLKMEAVVGITGKKKKKAFLVVGISVVFLAFAGFIVFNARSTTMIGPRAVQAAEGIVKIPLSEVQDGKAHFYAYNSSGAGRITFFVLKSSDSTVRAAFDSCDVCYRERKGYRQEGDFMVCNNCGQMFPSTRINELKGGCNPAPLNREVEEQHIVLRVSDIEQGRMYF